MRLEKRLDNLYSLIGTVVPLKVANPDSNTATVTTHLQSRANIGPHPSNVTAPEENQTAQAVNSTHPGHQTLTPVPSHGTAPTRSRSSSSLVPLVPEPAQWEAEELLGIFRDHMLKYVPFMIIPTRKSANQLRQESPFLWLCIMTITTKSSAKQTALGLAVRRHLGELMLVEGQISLDLLHGTIICVAW